MKVHFVQKGEEKKKDREKGRKKTKSKLILSFKRKSFAFRTTAIYLQLYNQRVISADRRRQEEKQAKTFILTDPVHQGLRCVVLNDKIK